MAKDPYGTPTLGLASLLVDWCNHLCGQKTLWSVSDHMRQVCGHDHDAEGQGASSGTHLVVYAADASASSETPPTLPDVVSVFNMPYGKADRVSLAGFPGFPRLFLLLFLFLLLPSSSSSSSSSFSTTVKPSIPTALLAL